MNSSNTYYSTVKNSNNELTSNPRRPCGVLPGTKRGPYKTKYATAEEKAQAVKEMKKKYYYKKKYGEDHPLAKGPEVVLDKIYRTSGGEITQVYRPKLNDNEQGTKLCDIRGKYVIKQDDSKLFLSKVTS